MKRDAASDDARLARLEPGTLMPVLAAGDRELVRRLARAYRFTQQELRRVTQAARDLEMWGERPLEAWWAEAERATPGTGRERKKALLRRLDRYLRGLAAAEKRYPASSAAAPPRRLVRLREVRSEAEVFGRCAAYSEKTVCCGLWTIDAVRGCPFGCSYCTIQTFYGDEAELDAELPSKLAKVDLDPRRVYHIGTGQSSDSLVWGARGGILDALLEFAAGHPNVLLELKTKSDNVRELLRRDLPPNVVSSWSLNSPVVIRNEEHGTAPLGRRLRAARAIADRGGRVAFHFHPMVYYHGWREDYPAVAKRLLRTFSPGEVAFLSMGAVTLIKPVARQIRRRGGETRILQMEMVPDPHGKLTYPDEVKVRLYRRLYDALGPWRERVFVYLCMETAAVWQAVLGRSYATNREFEEAFGGHCLHPPPQRAAPSSPQDAGGGTRAASPTDRSPAASGASGRAAGRR